MKVDKCKDRKRVEKILKSRSSIQFILVVYVTDIKNENNYYFTD